MIELRHGHYERDGFELAFDFAIPKGGIVAVLGPSGAGKSTLLNVIAGFEPLRQGTILLDGTDHTHTPPAQRPVNMVFQDNNTFAHMIARDNVALGLAPSLRLSQAQWTIVDEALDKVGLKTLAARKPGEMSGGERQRIALARTLVRKKPILLLDEAFAALGPALRRDMLELLYTLARGNALTVLMVTHQPEDAKAIAGEVMFVSNGTVRAPQPTRTFFESRDAGIRAYLGEQDLSPA
jgi:thiamine transport system ATP-binding protein